MRITRNNFEYKKNYSKVLNKVMLDKSISSDAFRLYMILSNCDVNKFTPSIRSLGDMLNLSDAGIDRCVKELKDRGYLHSTGSRNNVNWNIIYDLK